MHVWNVICHCSWSSCPVRLGSSKATQPPYRLIGCALSFITASWGKATLEAWNLCIVSTQSTITHAWSVFLAKVYLQLSILSTKSMQTLLWYDSCSYALPRCIIVHYLDIIWNKEEIEQCWRTHLALRVWKPDTCLRANSTLVKMCLCACHFWMPNMN